MVPYEYFEPEECWYCHIRGQGLSEHHLYRASLRKTSKTIWLCYKCHEKATRSKWFEKFLQKLYLKVVENKNNKH